MSSLFASSQRFETTLFTSLMLYPFCRSFVDGFEDPVSNQKSL